MHSLCSHSERGGTLLSYFSLFSMKNLLPSFFMTLIIVNERAKVAYEKFQQRERAKDGIFFIMSFIRTGIFVASRIVAHGKRGFDIVKKTFMRAC
jgi:hypothetical protein